MCISRMNLSRRLQEDVSQNEQLIGFDDPEILCTYGRVKHQTGILGAGELMEYSAAE